MAVKIASIHEANDPCLPGLGFCDTSNELSHCLIVSAWAKTERAEYATQFICAHCGIIFSGELLTKRNYEREEFAKILSEDDPPD